MGFIEYARSIGDALVGRRAAEPKPLPQLPGGAPVGDVMSGRAVQRQDPFAIEASAGPNLLAALRAADSGYLAALNAAITSAFVRDGRFAGVFSTRVLALTSRRWAVRPPVGYEQDRWALEVAQKVSTALYETPKFSGLRGHLAQGIPRPSAVLEHHWIVDRHGWIVSRPRAVEHGRTDYDIASGQWVIADGPHRGRPLSCWPDKFVVHSPAGGLALAPQMRGAARPLLGLTLAKRIGLRAWLTLIERFGQPQVYGQLPEHGSATTMDELVTALSNLSSHWVAGFKGDVKVDSIPMSVNDALHQKFVDWCNTEFAVLVLGGNLSSQSSDGQVYGSTAQALVRADIGTADLVELDETVSDQWIEPMVRFNAPGAPCPVIETVATPSRPFSMQEYQAGLCTKNAWLTSNGHDALKEGGDVYAAPQLPAFAQGTTVLSMPHPHALPSGGAAADAPFRQTSMSPTSPTSRTPPSGPARALLRS